MEISSAINAMKEKYVMPWNNTVGKYDWILEIQGKIERRRVQPTGKFYDGSNMT